MSERDSKRLYEGIWGQLSGWVEECVQSGMTHPGEILRQVFRRDEAAFLTSPAFQAYLPAPRGGVTLAVENNTYTLRRLGELESDTVQRLSDFLAGHDFDAVVELGSGTGRNLFWLIEKLGSEASRYSFHACEYTAAGRGVTQRLAHVGGVSNLSVHAFDYRTPDLSFLTGKERVLFFSVYSIEQVTEVPAEVVTEMLRRSAQCTCVHFEPVGWQADPDLVQWRAKRSATADALSQVGWVARRASDKFFGTSLARGFRGIPLTDVQIGRSDKTSLNAARWSAFRDYNKNLLEVLARAQSRGDIQIVVRSINFSDAGTTAFNPSTLVVWESASRAAH